MFWAKNSIGKKKKKILKQMSMTFPQNVWMAELDDTSNCFQANAIW